VLLFDYKLFRFLVDLNFKRLLTLAGVW